MKQINLLLGVQLSPISKEMKPLGNAEIIFVNPGIPTLYRLKFSTGQGLTCDQVFIDRNYERTN